MHVPQTISLRDVAIGVKWGKGGFADVRDRVELELADEILSGAKGSPALRGHGLCDAGKAALPGRVRNAFHICHAASPELSRAMRGKPKHPEDVYF